jgi:hypothetical protein
MNKGRSYTENELGEKIEAVEKEIKSIYKMRTIPLFYVEKSKVLFAKWKLLTNWKEDDTPAFKEPLEKEK